MKFWKSLVCFFDQHKPHFTQRDFQRFENDTFAYLFAECSRCKGVHQYRVMISKNEYNELETVEYQLWT